jgi:hypothetical protein
MKGAAWLVLALTGAMCGSAVAEGPRIEMADASSVAGWKTTIQQTGGNVQYCGSGNRGRVETSGNKLSVFSVFSKPDYPHFTITLAADGSADGETPGQYGQDRSGKFRVKVAPGSGPRLI